MKKVRVPDFGEKVSEARRRTRERAGEIQRRVGDERFLEWFDILYAEAAGDATRVPWADQEPHPILVEWLEKNAPHAGRALEVGCGIGDNAAALARAGYAVTAFDISPHAVAWARERFADVPGLEFVTADLFAPPEAWREAFDFVHETYTLQSLPVSLRARAFAPLASFLKPGGRMLVVCRARPDDEMPEGPPPWPLSAEELEGFRRAGLECLSMEELIVDAGRPIPHFVSLWRKPEA